MHQRGGKVRKERLQRSQDGSCSQSTDGSVFSRDTLQGPKNHYPQQSPSVPPPAGGGGGGFRGRGRGGYGSWGGRSQASASGANDTPLGTPKGSPPPPPAPAPAIATPPSLKRKADEMDVDTVCNPAMRCTRSS